jgi:hypothetical protein
MQSYSLRMSVDIPTNTKSTSKAAFDIRTVRLILAVLHKNRFCLHTCVTTTHTLRGIHSGKANPWWGDVRCERTQWPA